MQTAPTHVQQGRFWREAGKLDEEREDGRGDGKQTGGQQ